MHRPRSAGKTLQRSSPSPRRQKPQQRKLQAKAAAKPGKAAAEPEQQPTQAKAHPEAKSRGLAVGCGHSVDKDVREIKGRVC